MDKATFLSEVRTEWERWQALLDQVDPAWMPEPGAAGHWSVKDIIAHITWGEREMLGVIHQRALAGSPLWNVGQLARNTAVYEENKDRPLDDVLVEAQAIHTDLVQALEDLPEEHYGNPARYESMPAEWAPWEVFASNTYEHYREHLPSVQVWLEQCKRKDS